MENFVVGAKLTKNDMNNELIDWLNESQHYLEDISEGEYVFRIAKTCELPYEARVETLRDLRKTDCFPIINRGKIWYDTLTEYQIQELKNWYQAWLNVTITMAVPNKPDWLR